MYCSEKTVNSHVRNTKFVSLARSRWLVSCHFVAVCVLCHTHTSTHASAYAPAHTRIRTHLARPPRKFVAVILELVGKHCRALRLELLPPVDTADGRVKLIECLRRNVRLPSSRQVSLRVVIPWKFIIENIYANLRCVRGLAGRMQ